MEKLLSKDDIENIIGSPVNLIVYDELSNINNVKQLFNGYEFVLLLYRTSKNVGHWTGLKMTGPKEITFFDSYGLKVDRELDYIPIRYRAELSRILYYSGYKIEYNDYKLQGDTSNTCGRWVALFFLYCTNIDFFSNIFKIYKKFINLDKLVVLITDNLSN